MDYSQFIGNQIDYGNILFTIKDIKFWSDCFNDNKLSKITVTAKNNSNSIIRLWTNFYIVDENNISYCKEFAYRNNISYTRNENYFDIQETRAVTFSLYYPQTVKIIGFYYKLHDYEFGFNFEPNSKNSFITLQNNLLVERIETDLFRSLLLNIELATRQNISKEQAKYYKSQIEKQESICRDSIINGYFANYLKPYLLNKLKFILQDYSQKQQIPHYSYKPLPDNYNHIKIRHIKTFDRKSFDGEREDLDNIYFRSAWEANLARVLKYKNIQFEYEKECVVLGNLLYLPDFYLNENFLIEVKGVWDKESVEKVDAFIRTFPEKTLQIIDYDNYPELNNIYSCNHFLHNWEKTPISIRSEKVAVVGMRFIKDPSTLSNIKIGDKLTLIPEPENPFDGFAIRVQTMSGKDLGHIEKKFAAIYSQKLNAGMTFNVEILDITATVIRVKISRNNFDTYTIPTFLRN